MQEAKANGRYYPLVRYQLACVFPMQNALPDKPFLCVFRRWICVQRYWMTLAATLSTA